MEKCLIQKDEELLKINEAKRGDQKKRWNIFLKSYNISTATSSKEIINFDVTTTNLSWMGEEAALSKPPNQPWDPFLEHSRIHKKKKHNML